jgi:hypothetical protein
MPNLENLKKQAKQYLRWHRERYYSVAAQIRGALPRFRDMGDMEILESNFKLADAQELVARQMGFDGWQVLISGADAMSDGAKQTTSRPVLTSIEAQLFVGNIQSSCDFYTSKLGFAVAFVYGDPPFYAQVERDCARLNLRLLASLCSLAMFASAKVCFPLPSRWQPRARSNNFSWIIRPQESRSIRHLRRSHGAPEPLSSRIRMRT